MALTGEDEAACPACLVCNRTWETIRAEARAADRARGTPRKRTLRLGDVLVSLFVILCDNPRWYRVCHACYNRFRRCAGLCTQAHRACGAGRMRRRCLERLHALMAQLPHGSYPLHRPFQLALDPPPPRPPAMPAQVVQQPPRPPATTAVVAARPAPAAAMSYAAARVASAAPKRAANRRGRRPRAALAIPPSSSPCAASRRVRSRQEADLVDVDVLVSTERVRRRRRVGRFNANPRPAPSSSRAVASRAVASHSSVAVASAVRTSAPRAATAAAAPASAVRTSAPRAATAAAAPASAVRSSAPRAATAARASACHTSAACFCSASTDSGGAAGVVAVAGPAVAAGAHSAPPAPSVSTAASASRARRKAALPAARDASATPCEGGEPSTPAPGVMTCTVRICGGSPTLAPLHADLPNPAPLDMGVDGMKTQDTTRAAAYTVASWDEEDRGQRHSSKPTGLLDGDSGRTCLSAERGFDRVSLISIDAITEGVPPTLELDCDGMEDDEHNHLC